MARLRIGVMPGPYAPELAGRLREHDGSGLLSIAAGDHLATVGLLVGIRTGSVDDQAADALLDGGQPLTAQVDSLWSERVLPFARAMAGLARRKPGPPVLREHDPRLPAAASRMLGRIRDGLTRCGLDDGGWTYDHIGSTAVPDLRAKPFIDLQIGLDPLPLEGSPVDEVLASAGFLPTTGARPDSPGVYRDGIKDPGVAPPEAYRKRLYFRADPALPAIMHVRLLGSPWWSYTVQFRDWLRTNPPGRRGYEQVKQRAAEAHAHDADFDDYTRAKGAFFDQVQADYERTATRHGGA
jgi:dephospho-CoA kinase